MKVCKRCKLEQPLSSYTNASGGNYKRTECKDCANKLTKERNALRKIHGMPTKDYECPICLRKEYEIVGEGGSAGAWVIDHNHITATFRGWLCHKCNRGLGAFEDNSEKLMRAIKYLDNLH
jgi:hypothetical protein